MKQSVKIIVDSIEKEIQYIIDNIHICQYETERDFGYGIFYYEVDTKTVTYEGGDKYETLKEEYVRLKVNYVDVTNENSKVLTNLSNEVFNKLETTYTNY